MIFSFPYVNFLSHFEVKVGVPDSSLVHDLNESGPVFTERKAEPQGVAVVGNRLKYYTIKYITARTKISARTKRFGSIFLGENSLSNRKLSTSTYFTDPALKYVTVQPFLVDLVIVTAHLPPRSSWTAIGRGWSLVASGNLFFCVV